MLLKGPRKDPCWGGSSPHSSPKGKSSSLCSRSCAFYSKSSRAKGTCVLKVDPWFSSVLGPACLSPTLPGGWLGERPESNSPLRDKAGWWDPGLAVCVLLTGAQRGHCSACSDGRKAQPRGHRRLRTAPGCAVCSTAPGEKTSDTRSSQTAVQNVRVTTYETLSVQPWVPARRTWCAVVTPANGHASTSWLHGNLA